MILIHTKFRKRIQGYGKEFEVRLGKQIRDAQTMMFGSVLRQTLRERAKTEVLSACTANYEKAVMVAKFQKYIEYIILIQRIFKLVYIIKQHKLTASLQKSQDIIKASAGLKALIVAIFKNKVQRQEELLKQHQQQQYAVLDAIREETVDVERVDYAQVEELKQAEENSNY